MIKVPPTHARSHQMTLYAAEPNTATSYALYETDLGTFTAFADCHPEDIFNKEKGLQIARWRAMIQYEQALKNKHTAEYETLKNFYNSIKDMRKFNADSLEARRLRRAIWEKEEDIKDDKETIAALRTSIYCLLH